MNKPDTSRDLTIFLISFISLFEMINVVTQDLNIFLQIAASVADAAAVNPKCIKKLLANGLSTVHFEDNPVFSNGPKRLAKNPPFCHILCN